jgi:hypothetical protein
MSFSEKPDDEYSQKQSEQENNEDITNIEENQRNSINSSGNNINIPTKKRIVHCNITNFYFIV